MKLGPKVRSAAFIDAGLENYSQLIEGLLPGVQPFLLHRATDGLLQIHGVLQEHPELETVHIISHGSPGCLYLGNSQLSLDTLGRYQTLLQEWQIDNLLLYGCNVAAGDAGAEFVAKLQAFSGASIAATRTLTGAALKGGNWDLEVTTGKMPPTLALSPEVRKGYAGVLNLKLEWAENIGASGDDFGRGIATDSNGNVLITGHFQKTIDIDSDGNNDLIANGHNDSYIAKLDSNGNLVWAQNIGGSSGHGIATDSSDNVLVTGHFGGRIDIDSDGNNDLTANGRSDSYAVKLDSNGDLVWAKNIGGSDSDTGRGIATDSKGNVLVTGYFEDTVDIDSDGNNDLTGNGREDSYVAKLDSNGNLVWAKGFGDRRADFGNGIATDSSDNVLVTGNFENAIDIDSDGNNDLTGNANHHHSYVAKLDSNGNLVWAEKIGNGAGSGIAADSSGNVLVTGRFWGNIDIDSDGNKDLIGNGQADSYVAKLDSKGNLVWAQNIGGSGNDYGFGVATDSSGNVLVTGNFQNTIDIDSDGNNDLTSNGSSDSYIAKLDSNGNLVWAQNIGSSSNNQGRGIASDRSGNVLATGWFGNAIDINSDGSDELTSNGNWDSYVIKLSESPNSAPTDLNLSPKKIDENEPANTIVGTFSSTDSDIGDTFTYELVAGSGDTDNDAFTIANNKLQIDASPDYETQSSYSIRVKTTDAGALSYEETFTVEVNDLVENFAPTDLNLSPKKIDENEPANTIVGTFSTTDPDTGDTFTYELVAGAGDTDNNAFTIANNKLKIDASPDYETQSSYSIRVKTTDAGGLSYQKTLTVEVNDLDDESGGQQLKGTPGPDTLTGSEFDDTIIAFGGNDTIFGEEGNDILKGGGGNDILDGDTGNDTLKGGVGEDILDGGGGDDFLKGHQGNDTLQGRNGNDTLDGGDGNDFLDGGFGGDIILGGTGQDTLDGGNGSDYLDGDVGKDFLKGGNGNDTLDGGEGSDFLEGDAGKDILEGNYGKDTLFGGGDDDILFGGEGDDLLYGGAGKDSLYGDAGSDTFVLQAGMGRDNVYGFQGGVDLLQLGGGYSFGDLNIVPAGSSTKISIAASGETLAVLVGVNPASIDGSDFV